MDPEGGEAANDLRLFELDAGRGGSERGPRGVRVRSERGPRGVRGVNEHGEPAVVFGVERTSKTCRYRSGDVGERGSIEGP